MARVEPFRALRYESSLPGGLDAVAAPPYDVIDDEQRAALLERSPFNVVEIDLPESAGRDPYEHAAETFEEWRRQGILVRDSEPALWVLEQVYTGPDGARRVRRGVFARVRVEDYGEGRIRPHERTHPGPREDRLRLTRATRANLSPIFSLFEDPGGAARDLIEEAAQGDPFAAFTEDDGTEDRVWRVDDPEAVAKLCAPIEEAELLIADGHHRYETARVYAQEVGGEGEHGYVLMLLCPLSDPGLEVFPTHRLLTGLAGQTEKQQAIRSTLMRDFELTQVEGAELAPPGDPDAVTLGYLDSFHRQPYRLALTDATAVDEALAGRSEAYRRLDTAVLEALVLRGALGLSEDDISHLRGLAYSKSFDDARDAVESGRADACFFMAPTPIEQVRAIAAAGESMPPKSTYFFPKVPTGIVFNLLE